jgi:hypothetical protein
LNADPNRSLIGITLKATAFNLPSKIYNDYLSHCGVLLRVEYTSVICTHPSLIKVVLRSVLEYELYTINNIASKVLFKQDLMSVIGQTNDPTIVDESSYESRISVALYNMQLLSPS